MVASCEFSPLITFRAKWFVKGDNWLLSPPLLVCWSSYEYQVKGALTECADNFSYKCYSQDERAQWLSGRVLDYAGLNLTRLTGLCP